MSIITLANGQLFDTASKNVVIKKAKAKKLTGVVLWEGKSLLTGDNIAAIATLATTNAKTGNMVQTWIIRTDINPQDASKHSLDDAVCGNCPHRHSLGGGCYVTLFQAPRAVYNAYKKGNYPQYDAVKHAQFLQGRSIRLGAYGDPAAVPFDVWAELVALGKNHTGYTHQLGHKGFDNRIGSICMISADTENQAKHAQKLGFKTFRVKTENMENLDNELECLSQTHGISCLDCGLCSGENANITVNVHGHLNQRFVDKFERISVNVEA